MALKEDITAKIKGDFGNNSNEAMRFLNIAIENADYLKTDRVIRCIIFLAKGNLIDLKKYIESATFDTRDVMLWAEYKKLNGEFNFKRLRDFNKTFEECSNDVED